MNTTRITAALGAIAAAAALTLTAAHPQASSPAFGGITPQAVTAAYTSVNWTSRTCAAFTAWQHRHTAGSLDAMLTASERVTWRYLGKDAAALYTDIRGHGIHGKYVVDDIHNLTDDCHPGSGL